MAHTNALLVRLLLGDTGVPARDVSDGDATSAEFYLATPPILAGSALVYLAGSLKSSPGDYTLDTTSGRLLFAMAPPQGTGNIVVVYSAVQFKDADVDEACRQQGLAPTAVADTGESGAHYRAALMLAEGMAAYQSSLDAALSAQWAARASELRSRSSARTAMVAGPVKREDGYSQDRRATDVQTVGVNPRRRYYGEEDRIP